MPSTYSPNLRIELIANGEQSGTWGNTTNVNLGTLIEDAIAGYTSITTVTGNYALTALDGAADQSRNAILVLDTTIGSPYSVFIPPVSKVYVVKNVAAFNLTVYCSTALGNTTAAGVGVIIPPNKTTVIYADGVDVFTAVNYFDGDVEVTGDVNAGGTGTFGTPVAVSSGGTGNSSFTAFNLLRAGDTATGDLQTLPAGTVGQFLVSNAGASAPSWTNALDTATTAVTQAEKTANTSVATTAFVDRLRSLSTPSTGGVGGAAVIGDRGALLSVTGGVTIPASVFAANDTFSIYNNTSGNLLITQGAGLTLRQVGTANTGNRTLAQRGLVTVVFISSTEAVIAGGGLS